MYKEESYAQMFKYIENKKYDGFFFVEFDQPETPIHITNQEDINVLLVDSYEVDDY